MSQQEQETQEQETTTQPNEQETTQEQEQSTEQTSEEKGKGLLSDIEDPLEEYKEVLGDDFDEDKVGNLLNKYKTDDGDLDQKQLVKALYNANKMIGQKQGQAPENYELEKSENLKDFDFDENALNSFNELAKEVGLSNEQYNKLVNTFGENVNNQLNDAVKNVQEQTQEIIKSIDNFDDRALGLKRSLSSVLDEDQFNSIANSIESKEQFEAWENIVSKIKNSQIPASDTPAQNSDTVDKQIDDLTKQISEEKSITKLEELRAKRRELYAKRG